LARASAQDKGAQRTITADVANCAERLRRCLNHGRGRCDVQRCCKNMQGLSERRSLQAGEGRDGSGQSQALPTASACDTDSSRCGYDVVAAASVLDGVVGGMDCIVRWRARYDAGR